MNIDEITPAKGQRALILGGSRSGKSVLLDHLAQNIIHNRPHAEEFLLDSKPRFRAEIERFGPGGKMIRNADKHYTDWEKGPTVPGSYRLDLSQPMLNNYWKEKDPCRVVIAQTDSAEERPKLLEISDEWFQTRKRGADRIFIVDELLDFYYGNGVCISSRHNVPLKVNRAGGERGFSALYGAQRPKGIPTQITEELSHLYLFHLRFQSDMKYLWENGIPRDIMPPEEELYAFKHISIDPGGRASYKGMYRLRPSPSYLLQLSDT